MQLDNLNPVFTIELENGDKIDLFINGNIYNELIYKLNVSNYETDGYLMLDYNFYDYDLTDDFELEEFIDEILDKIDYYELRESLISGLLNEINIYNS